MSDMKLPELLCPAGTEAALHAAIEGGADAVYLGGTQMNARIYAGNFDPAALRGAVKLAHAHGVKVYLTLNTLVTDRELPEYLDAALDASRAGVDALIVADLITVHQKTGIGCLSAYCGAISAGVGAGAGICYLEGGRFHEIAHTLVNAVAILSGTICDGAKPSCAAKIAMAVEAGFMGRMA